LLASENRASWEAAMAIGWTIVSEKKPPADLDKSKSLSFYGQSDQILWPK